MPRAIHYLNEDIPCMEGDDRPYLKRWDFDPDDYRIVIGHLKHAHFPMVMRGRVCAFDEEPSGAFTQRIKGERPPPRNRPWVWIRLIGRGIRTLGTNGRRVHLEVHLENLVQFPSRPIRHPKTVQERLFD